MDNSKTLEEKEKEDRREIEKLKRKEENDKDERMTHKFKKHLSIVFSVLVIVFAAITALSIYRVPESRKKMIANFTSWQWMLGLAAMIGIIIGISVSPLWKSSRWKRAVVTAVSAFIIALYASMNLVFGPFYLVLMMVLFTGEA
jgi:cation transport ATPase